MFENSVKTVIPVSNAPHFQKVRTLADIDFREARLCCEEYFPGGRCWDGLNRYTYCHNNPVKYVDPTGNDVGAPGTDASNSGQGGGHGGSVPTYVPAYGQTAGDGYIVYTPAPAPPFNRAGYDNSTAGKLGTTSYDTSAGNAPASPVAPDTRGHTPPAHAQPPSTPTTNGGDGNPQNQTPQQSMGSLVTDFTEGITWPLRVVDESLANIDKLWPQSLTWSGRGTREDFFEMRLFWGLSLFELTPPLAEAVSDETSLLQEYVTQAAKEFDSQGNGLFTYSQLLAIERAPRLRPMFRGYQIDRLARDLIGKDPTLTGLIGRINRGPDFINLTTGQSWDMTTSGQWVAHVRKYGNSLIPLWTDH